MTALPIEGYAREYTDAAALIADAKARKARLAALVAAPPRPVVADIKAPEPIEVATPASAPEPAPEPLNLPSFRRVMTLVSERTGVSRVDLISERRFAGIARARQICCYLMRHCTTLSLPQIGRRLGGRDHTTALHGVRNITRKMESDADLKALIEEMTLVLMPPEEECEDQGGVE